jgi:subtilisin
MQDNEHDPAQGQQNAHQPVIHPLVHDSIDRFGRAELLVVLRPPGAAAAHESPEQSLSRLPLPHRSFPKLGVAAIHADRADLNQLAARSDVALVVRPESLTMIRPFRGPRRRSVAPPPSPAREKVAWGVMALGAPKLWDKGLTGLGVRIAHLDTGIDQDHPFLAGRADAFVHIDDSGTPSPPSLPADPDGHGTHTAGSLVGRYKNQTSGVAPDARLCSARVIEGGEPLLRVLGGLEWAISMGCRVLSMSLGFRGYTPFFESVMAALLRNGVLPVVAIGNEGPGTSRSPGNYPSALAVGACDERSRLAAFSGSVQFGGEQPTSKPDCIGPGVDVVSCRAGGGLVVMSGTSMSTPHVAGLAAILFQARPEATPEAVRAAILASCSPMPNTLPRLQGAGLPSAPAALRSLEGR